LAPVQIRKALSDDIDAMIQLANGFYRDTYEFTGFSNSDFVLGKNDNFALVAMSDGSCVGCVMVESPSTFASDEAEITILAVSGVGKRSVEELLIEAAEKNVGTAHVSFWVGKDDDRIGWLLSRGYLAEPGYSHFVADLAKLPEKPPVQNVQVRSMKLSEENEVIRVVNAAFGKARLTQEAIDRWRRDDPLFTEDWILVAVSNGEIVGVTCMRQDLHYNKVFRKRRGYMGPAATLPNYRTRGINKAINWYGLRFLKDRGMSEAALYTAENNLPVLKLVSSLGYEYRYTWKRFKKTVHPLSS